MSVFCSLVHLLGKCPLQNILFELARLRPQEPEWPPENNVEQTKEIGSDGLLRNLEKSIRLRGIPV